MRSTRLAVLVAVLALACGDSTGPTTVDVAVQDDVFAPSAVAITAGSTVRWTWQATNANAHDLTWVAVGVPGVEAQFTGAYERTFTIAGTFDYYCVIHGTPTTGMRGSVTVE